MKKALFLAIFLLPTIAFGAFSTNLTIGSTGPEVTLLQQTLVNAGCLNVKPTGYFGILTQQGVECMMGLETQPKITDQSEEIKSLKERILELEAQLSRYKEKGNTKENSNNKAAEIADEIESIDRKLNDYSVEFDFKVVNVQGKGNQRVCEISKSSNSYIDKLKKKRKELVSEYTELTGSSQSLPSIPSTTNKCPGAGTDA